MEVMLALGLDCAPLPMQILRSTQRICNAERRLGLLAVPVQQSICRHQHTRIQLCELVSKGIRAVTVVLLFLSRSAAHYLGQ
jgi:hypothetical protein